MEEATKNKKKSFEEMLESIDEKISNLEGAVKKSEENLKTTKEKIRRMKAETEELRKRKNAIFGELMIEKGIDSLEELEKLLALCVEKREDTSTREEEASATDASSSWREASM